MATLSSMWSAVGAHSNHVSSNGRQRQTWNCRSRPCEAEHFLSIRRREDAFIVAHRRYTLRYPLEFYDEGTAPFDIRLYRRNPQNAQLDASGYAGPVVVNPRKKRFTPACVSDARVVADLRCS
jgi:hypothetical protein